jgi:hypothetical protein
MIRILLPAIVVVLLFSRAFTQTSPAEQVSEKIARKMKDTLHLSVRAKQQIFGINMKLHQQSYALRRIYYNRDSLQVQMQKIENTRDALYSSVLSNEQFQLYKKKKKNLVNNH